MCFLFKTGKKKTAIKLRLLEVVQETKFKLKLTILIFWNRSAQKEYFQSIKEKVKTTAELGIFKIFLASKIGLKLMTLIFRMKIAQRGYLLPKT